MLKVEQLVPGAQVVGIEPVTLMAEPPACKAHYPFHACIPPAMACL